MPRTLPGILLGSVLCAPMAMAQESPQPASGGEIALESFSGRVLASGLEGPWEVTWGPDDMLG